MRWERFEDPVEAYIAYFADVIIHVNGKAKTLLKGVFDIRSDRELLNVPECLKKRRTGLGFV